ncbi:MAG: UDP-N-acetylmuramoyl-L-alanyl-D-glutamate--2,6-diaminopimelate ligase [Phycisphaerales bacterium]|nr:UDP-N-acetylmuramoyl-L-alanyl-D-glutamate--2,6-diaminopimelate ligase [Phycisphaerales bacterium]
MEYGAAVAETLIGTLLDGLDVQPLRGAARCEASRMVEDSRRVRQGDVFLARPGASVDGRDFIARAEQAGAAAILSDAAGCDLAAGPALQSGHLEHDAAVLAHRLVGLPSHHLDVVGVTGTNGKTTVTTLLHQLLCASGPSALMGGVVVDTGETQSAATLTTPMASDVANWLASAVQAGARTATMEVSSHALDQHRVAGVRFAIAIFTGLSGDHLDYHGTMDSYEACKRSLFENLDDRALAIVNLDDAAGGRVASSTRGRVLGCSLEGVGEMRGVIDRMSERGTTVTFETPWGQWQQDLPMIGRHNAMNALQAAAAALSLGLTAADVQAGLAFASGPPGRLQRVARSPRVIVDFAHTDGALGTVLSSLRAVAADDQRILLVVGCGGDRDRSKRPRMAEVAAEGADEVWLTSDNPRTEDPASILRDMAAGVPSAAEARVHEEVDRAAAIASAVAAAGPRDMVLIAGKGHEQFQLIGDRKVPFDDVETARAAVIVQGGRP